MSKFKIVLTYIDSTEKAEEITETLLKEKLAACVGIWPSKSRYWWEGKVEKNENELILHIKTKESLVDETMKKIKQLHPYDLPVIDVLDIEKINEEAQKWFDEVTK